MERSDWWKPQPQWWNTSNPQQLRREGWEQKPQPHSPSSWLLLVNIGPAVGTKFKEPITMPCGPRSFHPNSGPGWTPLTQRARQPVDAAMRAIEQGRESAEHIPRRTCGLPSTPAAFSVGSLTQLLVFICLVGEKVNAGKCLAASPPPWDYRRILGVCGGNIGRGSRSWWSLLYVTLLLGLLNISPL